MNDKLHKHIIGTEMEWGVAGRLEGTNEFLPLNGDGGMGPVSELFNKHLPEGVYTTTVHDRFMSNGSRYYSDSGGHIEYATPESLGPNDALLSELAGERFVAETLRQFVAEHRRIDEVVLYKRVIDDAGTSWGYHVNFSEDRRSFVRNNDTYNSEMIMALKPLTMHYATSMSFLGGGAVYIPKNQGQEPKYRYSLGQKIIDLEQDVAAATTSSKPYISTRDESHTMDKEKYIRVHIVGTDPLISPWATRMMFGTTSLVLAAIRQKKIRALQYGIPVGTPALHVAKQAMSDIEGTNRYEFIVDGQRVQYTDSDVQERIIEAVKNVSGKTAEDEWTIAEWEKAVTDRRTDYTRLEDRSDAIAKYLLIEQMNKQAGVRDLGQLALGVDKAYTITFRATKDQAQRFDTKTLYSRTLPAKLRAKRFGATMPPEEKIADRIVNAPESTRAYKRGKAILEHVNKEREVVSMNWGLYAYRKPGLYNENVNLDPWEGKES